MTKDNAIRVLRRALAVMVVDPNLRTHLERTDPKALQQAVDALLNTVGVAK